MTRRYIALLRGINVGRAKRIAMADLRAQVEALGYRHARTLLNSGNVVFDAPADSPDEAARRIEQAVETHLGVRSRVVVITSEELAAIVAQTPLREVASDPSRLLAAVLLDPADRGRLEPLARQDWAPEALALGPRVAFLWCADGVHKSRLNQHVARAMGEAITARNWATMERLHALASDA